MIWVTVVTILDSAFVLGVTVVIVVTWGSRSSPAMAVLISNVLVYVFVMSGFQFVSRSLLRELLLRDVVMTITGGSARR